MNYKKSSLIFKKINKATKILVNCHRSPDPDSVGSAISMKNVLERMGKKVRIVCPSDEIEKYVHYLKDFEKIETINFKNIDFSKYDLLITLDTSTWEMATDDKDISIPDITVIVIDHHKSNKGYGTINLIDSGSSSCCEILYWIYKDWGIELNKIAADALMAGIIGDTGAFRFPSANSRTFKTAQELIDLGADKNKAIHYIYRNENFNMIKFWGEVLTRMQIDKKRRFIWSAVPYDIYQKYGKPVGGKEVTATNFAQIIDGTDFGFIAIEQEKGILSVSFRSRTGFDTTRIATRLGGGGHVYASGAKVEADFESALKKVLQISRQVVMKRE
ncbi:bifunctional oligoribonuclease/PAP phosphatase NrnA [Candidatus Woesebacteria bacterium]|nr:bifunctional oligoribonuclease/PAP phosphatase NrnA [Candidatus Woesebacteria bacterium]